MAAAMEFNLMKQQPVPPDVTVRVGDATLHGHRSLFSTSFGRAASEMVAEDNDAGKAWTWKIDDLAPEDVQHAFELVYSSAGAPVTNKTPHNWPGVKGVVDALEKLQAAPTVKDALEKFLAQNMTLIVPYPAAPAADAEEDKAQTLEIPLFMKKRYGYRAVVPDDDDGEQGSQMKSILFEVIKPGLYKNVLEQPIHRAVFDEALRATLASAMTAFGRMGFHQLVEGILDFIKACRRSKVTVTKRKANDKANDKANEDVVYISSKDLDGVFTPDVLNAIPTPIMHKYFIKMFLAEPQTGAAGAALNGKGSPDRPSKARNGGGDKSDAETDDMEP